MYAHCKAEQESGGEVEDGKGVVDLGKQIRNQVALTSSELAPMFQSFTTFLVVPRPEEKAYLNYGTPVHFPKVFFLKLILNGKYHMSPWPLNKVEVCTYDEEQLGYVIPNDWCLSWS